MAITDERRKELILLLRQAEEVNEGRYLTPTAIRDILAMLREAGLLEYRTNTNQRTDHEDDD